MPTTQYYMNSTSTTTNLYPSYDVTYKAVWDPAKGGYVPQQIEAAPPGGAKKAIKLDREEDPIAWLRRRVEEICWKPA